MTTEKSGNRLGIGIVGLGMVARTHARALADLAAIAHVMAVYSPTRERRDRFGAEFGLPIADSLDALIHDDRIGAVLVLTPPNARMAIAERCAAAGKHVLMEKPIERTLGAAERIVALFEAARLSLGAVLQYRCRAASMHLKRIVADRSYGPLASVHAVVPWWRPQSYYDQPGRGTIERDGGGVLICQAIHSLDLLLWLCGPVEQIQAMARTTRLHRMESEDFVAAGLVFRSGAVGSVTATTADYPGFPEHLTLNFERASARLEAGTLIVWPHGAEVETFGEKTGTGGGADPMAFTHEWHRSVIEDFVLAVQQGRPPAITGKDALAVQGLIEAMMRSSTERRMVGV